MYFTYNEDGKIMICAEAPLQPNMVELDTPAEFDMDAMHDWRVEDGKLVYDPLPTVEVVSPQEERIAELEAALDLLLSGVTE